MISQDGTGTYCNLAVRQTRARSQAPCATLSTQRLQTTFSLGMETSTKVAKHSLCKLSLEKYAAIYTLLTGGHDVANSASLWELKEVGRAHVLPALITCHTSDTSTCFVCHHERCSLLVYIIRLWWLRLQRSMASQRRARTAGRKCYSASAAAISPVP